MCEERDKKSEELLALCFARKQASPISIVDPGQTQLGSLRHEPLLQVVPIFDPYGEHWERFRLHFASFRVSISSPKLWVPRYPRVVYQLLFPHYKRLRDFEVQLLVNFRGMLRPRLQPNWDIIVGILYRTLYHTTKVVVKGIMGATIIRASP